MKRMHLKKKKRFCFIIIIFLICICIHYIPLNMELTNSNTSFVKKILKSSNAHLLHEENNDMFATLLNKVNYELSNPITVLETAFVYEEVKPTFGYIENMVISEPRVYIYSTHPTEMYEGKAVSGYGSSANVIMASYLLQDKLIELGIPTVVEERSAKEYIQEHNLSYEESYVATREFLKDALQKYSNLDLIIDLHRDAGISKETTTVMIDGKSYARVMFVMKPTLSNINKAKEISDLTNSLYPNLSRGIYDQRNSYFNQDLNENAILLELGGNYNTVEEVVNTIEVFSKIIKEYLNER